VSAGRLLGRALAAEQEAYRAQLRGGDAAVGYAAARDAYLASHQRTGPRSWGRLIGALKMAILAGDGVDQVAAQALEESAGQPGASAAYAGALAAVALGREPRAEPMLEAGDAFARTGRALAALADGDTVAYAACLDAILADFAARDRHLAGVPVADTAMVLERLAEARGMAARPPTPLIPPSIYCDRTGL
jgi:hypothetical protein